MQGVNDDFLLYVGQKEEAELKLTSYRDQLTELARKRNAGAKAVKKSLSTHQNPNQTNTTQVSNNGKYSTVVFRPGEQPRFKRKLQRRLKTTADNSPVQNDGMSHVGKFGWQMQKKVKYVVDPACSGTYVTTAAIAGQEVKLEGSFNIE